MMTTSIQEQKKPPNWATFLLKYILLYLYIVYNKDMVSDGSN